ncbi:MAG: radical SAM protein [Candidatus Eremiobacteraeota bacterium]|nr:radical SAM protein [Candidatus Eremiobacteraeota bacterium]
MAEKELFEEQAAQGRLDDAGEFPSVVLLDTTSHCNLRCSMCVHRTMKRKRGVMAWDLFTKLIDEIALEDPTVRVWMVFFGEALILRRRKPSIFDMLAYAKRKGLTDVVLNSNLNILEGDDPYRLIESGLDAIYVGIDAATAETYGKLRVGGDFNRAVRNVERLIEAKRERASEKPGVFVQFVEMDSNCHEKDDFISYWTARGAQVKIRPKVSWGGLIEASNLVMGPEERWPCYWAMRTMSVTDAGKVVTCAVDLDAAFIAGDVTLSSMKQIWNTTLKDLREKHEAGLFSELPGICRNCRDWQSARADYYRQGTGAALSPAQ